MTSPRENADADGDRLLSPTVETLLEDPEQFETFFEGPTEGPLAVVGDPFAGREVVLDHAVERLDATRVRLEPGDGVAPVRDAIGEGPVVVDDCQHLYRRVIDGFEPLEEFLGLLATTEDPLVAGWNRYAWSYLELVRELDQSFGRRADVGAVAAEQLAELLLSRYDTVPEFAANETEHDRLFTVERYGVDLRGSRFSVPIPTPNLSVIHWRRADPTPEPRDVVFERLAAAADGNLGVASALWEVNRGDTIRPSELTTPTIDLTLDRTESFCLRILLAKERVQRAELVAIADGDLDRILGRLRRAGIVTQSEGVVSLDPTRVPAVISNTDRSRIL
ncbi:MAG: hypothetical protein V5A45_09085 [Haloarculaceae archaeon]